jgi:hypothetical protein
MCQTIYYSFFEVSFYAPFLLIVSEVIRLVECFSPKLITYNTGSIQLRIFIDNEMRLNGSKVEHFKDESNMQNVRELTYFVSMPAKDLGASVGTNTHIKKANEIVVQLHALRMATN